MRKKGTRFVHDPKKATITATTNIICAPNDLQKHRRKQSHSLYLAYTQGHIHNQGQKCICEIDKADVLVYRDPLRMNE